MWKKPSLAKPDFNKLDLVDMSEKEACELNGGATIVGPILTTGVIYKPVPPILSGMVALPFDIKTKPVGIETIAITTLKD